MNSNAKRRKSAVAGRTTRNFHSIMDVIFKGTARWQAGNDPCLKKVWLKNGGRWTVVDIVCPLLFVINDGKQDDQLCGRVNGHQQSQSRHHRSCNCKFNDLNLLDIQRTFLTTNKVNDICCNADNDVLHNLTLYTCIGWTMRSIGSRWGKNPMASSCAQSSISCTLYSMVSSCMP
jgi:hypothetical protein